MSQKTWRVSQASQPLHRRLTGEWAPDAGHFESMPRHGGSGSSQALCLHEGSGLAWQLSMLLPCSLLLASPDVLHSPPASLVMQSGRQQACLSTAGAAVDIEYQLQLAPSMPTILACLPAANS